ncbi:MAG: heme-binding domain-containing protein [Bacteroidetes bacterium]|nr:heme-binding domain-containing protein [Bacteroidota bacterium]MBS1973781.1 heme-binding domain-containing protein [Bacteroidota bacterium]
MLKTIIIILLVIIIGIQLFRPEKNISATTPPNGISEHFSVPGNVQGIIKKSCYDCHSNNTVYPWYYNIQPLAWWLSAHIKEGKKELNFSEFAGYAPKMQYHKLKAIVKSQKEGWMPIDSYLWIHRDAVLNQQQKDVLAAWADSMAIDIKTRNNLPDEPQRQEPD